MTRNKFLQELERELTILSKNESLEILQDYEEHFDLGQEAGKTEEEVANSLGAPNQIAKEILANYSINQEYVNEQKSPDKGVNTVRIVMMILMLAFFNLTFVIWIPITVFSLLFAFYLVAITLLGAPILVIINLLMNPSVFAWFDIFVSLAMCGIGYFLGMGMWYLTRICIRVLKWYINLNIKLVKGA